MTLRDKMKTYNFWISLVSAVLLIIRIIGDKYGFSVDSGLVMDITTGICGIFVILGIISVPQKNQNLSQNNNGGNVLMQNNENIKEVETAKNSAVGRFQKILLEMKESILKVFGKKLLKIL